MSTLQQRLLQNVIAVVVVSRRGGQQIIALLFKFRGICSNQLPKDHYSNWIQLTKTTESVLQRRVCFSRWCLVVRWFTLTIVTHFSYQRTHSNYCYASTNFNTLCTCRSVTKSPRAPLYYQFNSLLQVYLFVCAHYFWETVTVTIYTGNRSPLLLHCKEVFGHWTLIEG